MRFNELYVDDTVPITNVLLVHCSIIKVTHAGTYRYSTRTNIVYA